MHWRSAVHARVFTYQVQPGRMAERLSYGRELVGLTRQQPGYRGLFVLIDPDTHANVSIRGECALSPAGSRDGPATYSSPT
jgi:hypothetical protein